MNGIKIVKASKEMGKTNCPFCGAKALYFVISSNETENYSCQSCYDIRNKESNGFKVKDFNFKEILIMQEGMEELAQHVKNEGLGYYGDAKQFHYLLEMIGGHNYLTKTLNIQTVRAGLVAIKFTKNEYMYLRLADPRLIKLLYKLFLYPM